MSKTILFIALMLYCSLLSFCNTPVTEAKTTVLKNRNTDTVPDFHINIINQSNYLNPGFVRCPLLAITYEPNIFIAKEAFPNFKKIACDEYAELFYSGNTYIPYVLKHNDSIYIKDGKLNSPYLLYTKNEVRNNEINFFQAAFNNKIPLLYWEMGNQMKGLIEVKKISNNIKEVINYYKLVQGFSNKYFQNNPVSDDFKIFMNEYIRFDHYIKIFTYINKKPCIDSLVKVKYFDFSTDTSNIFHNCNYALQGALYQYATYHMQTNSGTKELGNIFQKFDSIFNKTNSSLMKFLFLKNFTDSLFSNNKASLIGLNKSIGNLKYQQVVFDKINSIEFNNENQNRITLAS